MLNPDQHIEKTVFSIDDVKEVEAKLSGGKAAGICNITAELVRAGAEAMVRALHVVLTIV